MKSSMFVIVVIILSVLGCKSDTTTTEEYNTYDSLRTQRVEYRDSLYAVYTVREWARLDWWTWALREDMECLTINDVSYHVVGTFYSPDRKKIILWMLIKKPNAKLRRQFPEYPQPQVICPLSGDTIWNGSALIGMRSDTALPFELYPLDNQMVTCYDDSTEAISILGEYYFQKMKNHQMYKIIQSGYDKGIKALIEYGYNLQDKEFWDKCWLWERDTVGSEGYYNFQIIGYDYNHSQIYTRKSGEPYRPPVIVYPDSIMRLYGKKGE